MDKTLFVRYPTARRIMDSEGIAIKKIVSDMEIGVRIYMQYCDINEAVVLPQNAKDDLLKTIMEVMRKLEATRYHRDNLLKILGEEIKKEASDEGCAHIDLSTGAEKELEAFIMQGKSCLDVLTKIFKPLIGVKIHSYGDSGEKVVKVLENNLADEEKERAEPLINMIREDRQWIERWFKNERNSITHYRTVESTGFVRQSMESGDMTVGLPETSDGIPLHEIVTTNYHNLLSFCEDFVALSVSIKFHPSVILGVLPEERRDKDYPRKFGLFIRTAKEGEVNSTSKCTA